MSIDSGVVSLRNLRLVIFLGKLNNLELLGADIGNAYLQAVTEENMLLQQKSAQMGNNFAEQQINNNNTVKAKQQTQEQLSSPLSQVLKTYDFGKF